MSEQQTPPRLVFRVPQVSILAALLVAICATPLAVALPVLSLLYVIPVAAIVWVLRVRTVANASGLTVRKLAGSTALPWDDLKGLLLTPKGTVTAVRSDDSQVPLPSVRTRHLPALALISGGRITDPTAAPTTPENTDPPPHPGGAALGQSTDAGISEGDSSTGAADPAAQEHRSTPE